MANGTRARPSLLHAARRPFVVATLALLATGATVAIIVVLTEHTRAWVRHSRQIATTARGADALAVDRATGVRGFLATGDSTVLRRERVARPALATLLDSLDRLTTDDAAQRRRVHGVRVALDRWERGFAAPALGSPGDPRWRTPGPDGLAGTAALDGVRASFHALLAAEEARYETRTRSDTLARRIALAALALEIAFLAWTLVLLQRRHVAQTTDLLRQRELLEAQAADLTAANREMTAAHADQAELLAAIRRAEGVVSRTEAQFRALVEQSPEAIMLHADERLLYLNPACAALLGIADAREMIGRPVLTLVHDDSRATALARLSALREGHTKSDPTLYRFVRQDDGRPLDLELLSVLITFAGRPAVQTHARDVTARLALEAQLAHQAFHDPLTGLANRVLFRDRVEHALARAGRAGPPPVVLLLDLDNFKAVNDTLGHATGDGLLVEIAARLRACLREVDTCARFGGDEFALLIEDADDVAVAAATAERVIAALSAPIGIDGTDVVTGASIGIAAASPGQAADELLRNADLAMYRAKAAGKRRYELFAPEMHAAVRRRFELESELRRVIEGDASAGVLVLHYQPIVETATGRVRGAEALVRWSHPTRGLVPPAEFIGIAEETGLILPLGRWVLGEACRQLRAWRDTFDASSLSMTVNLSGRQLTRPELVAEIASAVAEAGVPAQQLVLEMTESMLVQDNRATLERLHALKALGVRLAIDDFGTGYSSLAYLERFPVDVLKIDRSFVRGLGNGHESPITRAVVGLARTLGMTTVAEGVESERQLARLRELECDLGQGYLFARPLEAPAMAAMLESER